MADTWKTRDGQVLDVRWMTTAHLCHSYNLLWSKNINTFGFRALRMKLHEHGITKELKRRRAYQETDGGVKIRTTRETVRELCMMNAALDHDFNPGLKEEVFTPETIKPGSRLHEVYISFCKYRLLKGG